MSEEDNIKQQLVEKFAFLGDKVTVQRARRIFVDVPLANFSEVFDYAVNQLGFSIMVTITGLDEGSDARIYLSSGPSKRHSTEPAHQCPEG